MIEKKVFMMCAYVLMCTETHYVLDISDLPFHNLHEMSTFLVVAFLMYFYVDSYVVCDSF